MPDQKHKRIAIISNPQGGYNRRRGLKKIELLAAQRGIPHIEATTQNEMAKALSALAAHEPEILVINGGDGSVDMALRLIRNQNPFKKEPALALLKGGTTNLIHRDIGLRGTPHKAFQKIIDCNAQVIERRPLEIRCEDHENAPLYGFFLGTGAIPRATLKARETLHGKGLSGPFSEMLMLGGLLMRLGLKRDLSNDMVLKPSPLIRGEHQEDHIFLALSTLKKLIPCVNSPATNDQAGIMYMNADRKLKREKTSALKIETGDPWVLDGEMHAPGTVEIKLGKPVKFLSER